MNTFASRQRDRELIRRARGFDGTPRGRGRAFDAAGASGFAFLQSQLELIDTDVVRPLQATTHARDISVDVGGGFPQYLAAFATNYGTTGTQFFGLQGTNNTDIPEAQADIQKSLWKTYPWAMAMTITYIDLERLATAKRSGMPPPISLQEMYEESVDINWVKALDYVTYKGFLGDPGLINNPNVVEFVVPAGAGGSTTWVKKSPTEILFDVNNALNQVVQNSGYDITEAMPDSLLLPYSQFATLSEPMAIGGSAVALSTIAYIERECVAAKNGINFKINSLPNPWISGTGAGGLDRAVFYKNSKKSLYLKIPQPKKTSITVPTMQAGGAYQTGFVGCISQVIFKRNQTMIYADGI
jgi:hypothetical protein